MNSTYHIMAQKNHSPDADLFPTPYKCATSDKQALYKMNVLDHLTRILFSSKPAGTTGKCSALGIPGKHKSIYLHVPVLSHIQSREIPAKSWRQAWFGGTVSSKRLGDLRILYLNRMHQSHTNGDHMRSCCTDIRWFHIDSQRQHTAQWETLRNYFWTTVDLLHWCLLTNAWIEQDRSWSFCTDGICEVAGNYADPFSDNNAANLWGKAATKETCVVQNDSSILQYLGTTSSVERNTGSFS